MNNLIKAERYKLFHNWAFWALLIGMILLGFFSGSGYRQYYLAHDYEKIAVTSFSGVFNSMVADSTMPLVAVCAMLAWFMGRDFSLRTISTEVASGHSRRDIFISKAVVNLIAFNAVMLLYPMAGAIHEIGYFGIGDLTGNILNILRTGLYVLLLQSAFFLITITIAFIVRNGIVSAIVAPIVSFGIMLVFAAGVENQMPVAIYYLNPIYRLREATAMGSSISSHGLILVPAIITGVVWIAACSMIIWKTFVKGDLK